MKSSLIYPHSSKSYKLGSSVATLLGEDGYKIISETVLRQFSFEKECNDDIKEALTRTSKLPIEILKDSDTVALPRLVVNYLRSAGVIGKPKVYNMKVRLKGEMRNRSNNTSWFDFKSEQYNFFDIPQRNFVLAKKQNKIPVWEYHRYVNGKATIDIKALATTPMTSLSGTELNISETVTLFSDMCMLAPASLIDQRISWQPIDHRSVLASFTNANITIKAKLYFNKSGQLINFTSEDKIDPNNNRKIRFSALLNDNKISNRFNLTTTGTTTWDYTDGPYAYSICNVESIEYNVKPKALKHKR